MAIHKLDANFVETASKKKKGLHNDGGGLYGQVGEDGETGSWIFRFVSPVTGRQRYMGLGSFNTIGLAKARDEARKCREQVKADIDPIEARKAAAEKQRQEMAKETTKRRTLAECFEQWTKLQDWAEKTLYGVNNRFNNYVRPKLGNLPVTTIDADLIEEVVAPIWEITPTTGKDILRELGRMLNWAADALELPVDTNAVRRVRARLKPFSRVHEKKPYRALSWQEMGAFMARLRGYISPGRRNEHPLSADALEFGILTAARSHQVREMIWDDIDPRRRVWKCLKHKIVKKTKKPLLIPLSGDAWTIIERMHEQQARDGLASDYVFAHTCEGNPYYKPTRGGWRSQPLKPTTMRAFLRDSMQRPDLDVHGFRKSFRSWAEENDWPFNDAEIALGHIIGNSVQETYREQVERLEPRREMMEAWAEHCRRIKPLDAKSRPKPLKAKVIPMKRTVA
jgi:integrase